MKCPACKAHLNTRKELQKGLNALICMECEGNWIPNKSYRSWLNEHGDTLPEKPFMEIIDQVYQNRFGP
ncbi:MAG: zf-TFIIB domain-containing protein [Kiritimatiellia bacterium]